MIHPRELLNRAIGRITDAPCWKCGKRWHEHPRMGGPGGGMERRCQPEPTPEPPDPTAA